MSVQLVTCPQHLLTNPHRQCAIPVFEDLFPDKDVNNRVLDLLFTLADWHALAKLRLHTDTTIQLLKTATTTLGTRFRHFVKHICSKFHTKELPRETAARGRRQARKVSKATGQTQPQQPAAPIDPKIKLLNLLTYKFHALGDYIASILRFGSTDSYSTQTVSAPVNRNHKTCI